MLPVAPFLLVATVGLCRMPPTRSSRGGEAQGYVNAGELWRSTLGIPVQGSPAIPEAGEEAVQGSRGAVQRYEQPMLLPQLWHR